MIRASTLVLTERLAQQLHKHLFPGDGLEAAALLFCAEVPGRRLKLLVREFLPVPYSACTRAPDSIVWPGEHLEAAMDHAEARGDIIIAIHSHPAAGWNSRPPMMRATSWCCLHFGKARTAAAALRS